MGRILVKILTNLHTSAALRVCVKVGNYRLCLSLLGSLPVGLELRLAPEVRSAKVPVNLSGDEP